MNKTKLKKLTQLVSIFKDAKIKMKDSEKCVICGKEIQGYGNNAEPIAKGRCCDDCNINVVIPARLKGNFKDANPELEKIANAIKNTNDFFSLDRHLQNAGYSAKMNSIEDFGIYYWIVNNKYIISSKKNAKPGHNDIVQGNFVIGIKDAKIKMKDKDDTYEEYVDDAREWSDEFRWPPLSKSEYNKYYNLIRQKACLLDEWGGITEITGTIGNRVKCNYYYEGEVEYVTHDDVLINVFITELASLDYTSYAQPNYTRVISQSEKNRLLEKWRKKTKDSCKRMKDAYNVYEIEYYDNHGKRSKWITSAKDKSEAVEKFAMNFYRMGIEKDNIIDIRQTNRVTDSCNNMKDENYLSDSDITIIENAIDQLEKNNINVTINNVLNQIDNDMRGFLGSNQSIVIEYLKNKGIRDSIFYKKK